MLKYILHLKVRQIVALLLGLFLLLIVFDELEKIDESKPMATAPIPPVVTSIVKAKRVKQLPELQQR